MIGTHPMWLQAIKGSGVTQPLRFASPANHLPSAGAVQLNGAYIHSICRMPVFIGSGDMSELRLSFNGFNDSSFSAYGSDYTVMECALEKDGGTYTTVTFSGSNSKLITAGSVDQQSDAIYPSAFSLSKFTRGEKYWLRVRLSVPTSGMYLPSGDLSWSTIGTGAIGLWVDPATWVGSPIYASGTLTYSAGLQNNPTPYMPLVLGRFISGDPKTIIGVGDSIMASGGDSGSNILLMGWQRSLVDADGVSNPIGGCRMATPGSLGAHWLGANAARGAALLKYGKHLVEEFGTNQFGSVNTMAGAQTTSQTIWALARAAGVVGILKPLLTPRTTSTDSWATTANQTLSNASWQAGGGARNYNDWCVSQVGTTIQGVVQLNSVRVSSTQGTDDYYRWLNDGTANKYTSDGVHPAQPAHILMAADYRTAYASLT